MWRHGTGMGISPCTCSHTHYVYVNGCVFIGVHFICIFEIRISYWHIDTGIYWMCRKLDLDRYLDVDTCDRHGHYPLPVLIYSLCVCMRVCYMRYNIYACFETAISYWQIDSCYNKMVINLDLDLHLNPEIWDRHEHRVHLLTMCVSACVCSMCNVIHAFWNTHLILTFSHMQSQDVCKVRCR
jgi:hypothetical protein